MNYSDKGCRLEQGYLVFLMSVCFAAYHLENKLIIIIIKLFEDYLPLNIILVVLFFPRSQFITVYFNLSVQLWIRIYIEISF